MIPELGHFASILALLVAMVQAAVSMMGATWHRPEWIVVGLRAARVQFALLATAFTCLAAAFVSNDFTVLNVASNSHSQLPIAFRFAATWGSHEGSLLLWTLMLAIWTAAVSWFSRGLPEAMLGRVIAVLGAISAGFLLFMLATSNPFLRVLPAPADGLDLNPALQDAAMVAHPPLLYMGYVGFSVAFAFAVAALLEGRLDAVWARWSRPWATLAWTFLTCGIALGSFWAYYELGWGGWWFWDPVENASFMPWLAGTALIHSLAVTDRRGVFRSWTVLLAIATFSLSLLGAFLVRSGVLTSVHAFATDPSRGVFLLCFLTLVIGGSLGLYAVRAGRAVRPAAIATVSRESLLLLNNVFLSVAACAVLLGTLYPLFIDVLGAGKLSVGPPYFNAVFVSVMAPAMFLLGVGPMARWRKAGLPELAVRLRWALAASLAASAVIPLAAGEWKPRVSLGLLLALWIMTTIMISLSETVKAAGGWRAFSSRPHAPRRGFYGMHLAHAGIAVSIVGITIVTGYQDEKDLRIAMGDQMRVGGYTFTLRLVKTVNGPNYVAAQADIDVFRPDGRFLRTLAPQKRLYAASQNAMAETAIDSGVFRDLYLSLGEPLPGGAWQVRIQYKPFVDWIWFGAILMACGGALAISDPRYRRVVVADLFRCGGEDARRRSRPSWMVGSAPVKFAAPFCVFAAMSVFLVQGLRQDPRQIPSVLIDKPAPFFELAELQDSTKTLGPTKLLGTVWLLNVWASWCVSCRAEHALLTDLARSGAVPVYGLDYKDEPDAALTFLRTFGNPYKVTVQDPEGRVGIDYGVYGVPETYVIDAEGVIRFKQIGALTADVLEQTILPLVGRLRR